MEQADEATEFGYNPQRKEKLNKGNALYNFRGFVICLWTDRIEDESAMITVQCFKDLAQTY